MIRLTKQDLTDFAQAFVLANTPGSLYRELLKHPSVRSLARKYEPVELETYYDQITARATRTEIEMGLAYALLTAILINEKGMRPIDTSRLRWGPAIEDLASKSGGSVQNHVIQIPTPPPTVTVRQVGANRSVLIIPNTKSR